MSAAIIQQWLDEVSRTVQERKLPAHLNLISRRVQLTGVPEVEQERIPPEDVARHRGLLPAS